MRSIPEAVFSFIKNCGFPHSILFTGIVTLQFGGFCFEASSAPVSNDRFFNAQVISGSSGSRTASNVGASKESGEPDHAGDPGGSSIWFRWTAPASGQFSFNTFGSSFDTLLAVYTGGSLGSLIEVTSNDDYGFELTSEVSFLAAAGTTYQVGVDGYSGETGSLILNWAPEVAPVNDKFVNATVINGLSGTVNANNTGATMEPGEPIPDGGRSIWFRWTAPAVGPFTFNTAGSAIDTLLGVYTGGSVNALTEVAFNDDFEGEITSAVTFGATSGRTYFVAIDGRLRHAGPATLNWAAATNEIPDASAFTFRTLHHFTNMSDGAGPHSELILAGETLYGTTSFGGSSGNGTVFKVNRDGTGYSIIHNFNYSGGSAPYAGLILSSNTLYGTTRAGGSSGWGTVFAVRTNGTGFTNLYKFSAAPGTAGTNHDGALPHAPLTLSSSGTRLYGATTAGGRGGKGTLFAVNTDGMGFTNLYHFSATSTNAGTNSDGATPYGGLILAGDALYGTAFNGGPLGYGTVFSIKTNGTGFTRLRYFGWETDGAAPHAMILSGNRLYGTGMGGGTFGNGVVFALNTDGSDFTNLYRFSGVWEPLHTNKTGANPFAGLVLAGDTLYGTTLGGGSGGKGTVFAVTTNGSSFKSLYHFTPVAGTASTNSDGASLRGSLVFSDNALYGTAERGGRAGYGTVFGLSLTPRPSLMISLAEPNVILRWAINSEPFSLQVTTNSSVVNSWSAVEEPTVTNSGEISVTVPVTGDRKIYRLSSP